MSKKKTKADELVDEAVITRGGLSHPNLGFAVVHHHNHMLNSRANFAARMVERWGMVTAEVAEGDYDKAGRAVMRPMSPQALVDRAFEVTDIFFETAIERGWVLKVPTAEEARAQVASQRGA